MSEFFPGIQVGFAGLDRVESVYHCMMWEGCQEAYLLLAIDKHSHKAVVTLIALVITEARYPGSAFFQSLIR